MRGFPKYINTKEDVAILQNGTVELGNKKNYPSEMAEYTRKMQEERFCWQVVKELAKDKIGIEDKTHQITTEEMEDGQAKRLQVQLVEDKNAKFFRLSLIDTAKDAKDATDGS